MSTHPMPTSDTATSSGTPTSHVDVEQRIASCGDALLDSLGRLLEFVPESAHGPQRLATALKIDKVLASRLLKAMRAEDSMCAIHRMPGPDPLRRVTRAASKLGLDKDTAAKAEQAIGRFEHLIRVELGDRSSLEAVLSAWVPEARRDFQLRRKQAAFRAVSELKGVASRMFAETAFLTPSEDGERIDVVWMKRIVGLERLRPHARAMLSSFRGVTEGESRRTPLTLSGKPITTFGATMIERFSTVPAGALRAEERGETIYYLLSDDAFGPEDAIDLCTVEVNRNEISRYVDPSKGRVAWFSSETSIPARRQQLDVFVHRDLFGGVTPSIRCYDTSITGIVDVNDPSSEMNELDLGETIEDLGSGFSRARSSHIPRYHAMLELVSKQVGLDDSAMRGYRCIIDYPFYGAQTAMLFPTVARPAE